MTRGQDLPAGPFAPWLLELVRAQEEGVGIQVPCGECTACCTSSQFIHIAPSEEEALARIPGALLFPAPGLPKGHVVLGYDEHGHCPMFADGRCSIYEHRPRTCRTYDCRALAAAGGELDEADKALLSERTRRWRFDVSTPLDQALQSAVRAAAAFLREHAAGWPEGLVPRNPTQLAFLAIQVHDVFLERAGGLREVRLVEPPAEVVRAAVLRARGAR